MLARTKSAYREESVTHPEKEGGETRQMIRCAPSRSTSLKALRNVQNSGSYNRVTVLVVLCNPLPR